MACLLCFCFSPTTWQAVHRQLRMCECCRVVSVSVVLRSQQDGGSREGSLLFIYPLLKLDVLKSVQIVFTRFN